MNKTVFATLIAVLSVGLAAPAFAHPRLLSTTPAARATIAATNRLSLTFSEKLMPQLSSIDLVMTGMPGMAHAAPMKMTGATTSVSKDGKTLVATFARPLMKGTYRLDWHVVSVDTHRVTGSLNFTVR